jgi:hypothetical protein
VLVFFFLLLLFLFSSHHNNSIDSSTAQACIKVIQERLTDINTHQFPIPSVSTKMQFKTFLIAAISATAMAQDSSLASDL